MKQVIAVRRDLDLSKGKTAAQVAHASLGAYRKADKGDVAAWDRVGSKKVVVFAEDEEELMELKRRADSDGIPTYLVRDAGRTEIPKGTTTALAMGPCSDEEIDRVTGHLSLVN